MEDLIVIILTLLIAGVGALGKLKKKNNTSNETADSQPAGGFWDLIQGESNLVQQEEIQKFDEPNYAEESYSDFHEEEVEIKAKEPVYAFDGTMEGSSEIIEEKAKAEIKREIRSGLLKDFSLRKAVVYSEILNRKYI